MGQGNFRLKVSVANQELPGVLVKNCYFTFENVKSEVKSLRIYQTGALDRVKNVICIFIDQLQIRHNFPNPHTCLFFHFDFESNKLLFLNVYTQFQVIGQFIFLKFFLDYGISYSPPWWCTMYMLTMEDGVVVLSFLCYSGVRQSNNKSKI